MSLPSHLFVSSDDGALYDTRIRGWHALSPLRATFSRHTRKISRGLKGTAQVRAALRAGPYAWPGGYALYFVAHDGEPLSFAAVRENLKRVVHAVWHGDDTGWGAGDEWRVVGIASTEESDEEIVCAHTGAVIG